LAETTPTPTLLSTPDQQFAYIRDRVLKYVLLFRKYGIDPNDQNAWRDLALALARRHEPGYLRPRGRPKEHDDDVELILMIELLRCRDGLTIADTCKAIAEKGAIKGKPKTLQNRYKALTRHRHWKVIIRVLKILKAKFGDRAYIEASEWALRGKI
jgi:hypothetical protein